MNSNTALKYQVTAAVRACEEKQAEEITILRLDKNAGSFTDYFVICSGGSPRQIQAIADEVRQRMRMAELNPVSAEGYHSADWILMDYVDFVVHIFSHKSRKFYNLERLWKSARRLSPAELLKPERKRASQPARTAKKAGNRNKARAQGAARSVKRSPGRKKK